MKTGQSSLSYSSSIWRNILYVGLTVKYCYKIFDDKEVEKQYAELSQEFSGKYI